MKISKLLCLLSASAMLMACGNNKGQELTPQEKLLNAFELGDNYKASLDMEQYTLDEQGSESGKFIVANYTTREDRKFEVYSNMKSINEYTLNEFLSLCSEEFETEITIDTLPMVIDSFALMGMDVTYDDKNDIVSLTMNFINDKTYYNYNASGEFKDIYATQYSIRADNEKYAAFHVLKPIDSVSSISIDKDYASHFTYSEKEDIYTYNTQYGIEDEIGAESINKYTIKLEDGKVSKIEMDYLSGQATKTHLVVSYSFTYGNQKVELPTDLKTCAHTYGEQEDYHSEEIDGQYYHYHECSTCNDIIGLEKCQFNEEGHCSICGTSATEKIIFFTVDEYDGYFGGLVYGYVNTITNKIECIDCDNFESIDIIDYSYETLAYEVDGITLDSDNGEYIAHAAIYEYGGQRYCAVEVYSFITETDVMYILDNVTYEVSGEEDVTVTIHGNIIQTVKVGDYYSKP